MMASRLVSLASLALVLNGCPYTGDPPQSAECVNNDHCEGGKVCIEDKCWQTCTRHEQCAETEVCDLVQAEKVCKSRNGECGDGDKDIREECDEGGETATCNMDCTKTKCDDGYINELAGEECDNGIENSNSKANACREDCTKPRCGDGVPDDGEQCDLGVANSDFVEGSCTLECRWMRCGDGILDPGEECDEGIEDTATCNYDEGGGYACTLAICGDGYKNAVMGEACDDGNNGNDCDGCLDSCTAHTNVCGDNYECGTEQCDDGSNGNDCDGCLDNCTAHTNVCGDVYRCGTEQCDDGKNGNDCDGCLDNCTAHTNVCGDVYRCGTEQCDDGKNGNDCDGCLDNCSAHTNVCGDAYRCGTEQCDDGSNGNDCDGCLDSCTAHTNVCGDNYECGTEQCDDGRDNSNSLPNACRENCTDPRCGDGVKDDWEECDLGDTANGDGCNSICDLEPGWKSVPGGTFMMGCSLGDTDCEAEESPRHGVTVSPFLMMATEVTQEHYESVMGSNPSLHTGCPTCPAERIEWRHANAFCEEIGARLPSEAEWEYAARGGTAKRHYCGNDSSCLDGIAWYRDNSDSNTHPVGQKRPNAYGLYDMLGNVNEWAEDCWHENYSGAPGTGGVWTGGNCRRRMLRGGSWYDLATHVRASYRRDDPVPGAGAPDNGVRCAR